MRLLGHERFAVAGHDRGSYVAMRLALDHPAAVTHLAVLDGVPIGEALARADARFATAWWHWFFLGQPDDQPDSPSDGRPGGRASGRSGGRDGRRDGGRAERVINADPESWYHLENVDPMVREDLRRAVRDPAVVHAMVGDYRAGLTVDRAADDADAADGRRIGCPVLFCWSTRDDMIDLYGDPLAIWRRWAGDVTGVPIESGHHMAEENPVALTGALRGLMRR
jgi:haloacetate dehalogenase